MDSPADWQDRNQLEVETLLSRLRIGQSPGGDFAPGAPSIPSADFEALSNELRAMRESLRRELRELREESRRRQEEHEGQVERTQAGQERFAAEIEALRAELRAAVEVVGARPEASTEAPGSKLKEELAAMNLSALGAQIQALRDEVRLLNEENARRAAPEHDPSAFEAGRLAAEASALREELRAARQGAPLPPAPEPPARAKKSVPPPKAGADEFSLMRDFIERQGK